MCQGFTLLDREKKRHTPRVVISNQNEAASGPIVAEIHRYAFRGNGRELLEKRNPAVLLKRFQRHSQR